MIQKNLESLSCLFIWSTSVFYSLYRFYYGTQKILHLLDPEEFDPGWITNLRYRDVADTEWSVLRKSFNDYWFLIALYISMSQIFWKFFPQHTLTAIVIYGSLSIGIILSFYVILLVWLIIVTFIVLHCFTRQVFAYVLCLTNLFLLHGPFSDEAKLFFFDQDQRRILLFDVLIAWLNAKCLSFFCDRKLRAKDRPYSYDLTMVFAYCLYFPTLFTGPIHQYENFSLNMKYRQDWSMTRLILCSLKVMRYAFWAFVYEVMIHFLYSSALQYQPELTDYFDSWTLCGFGYCLPCLFHIKYLVIYGIAGALAEMDAVKLPPPPKCVTRIHSSTNLWRYFDRGLHLWLSSYFYKPIVSLTKDIPIIGCNKIPATFASFFCICLWHGFDTAVIVWCLLNFVEVTIERLGTPICYQVGLQKDRTPSKWSKRIRSAIASPFFVLMIISNVFFLSNFELGVIFFYRIFLSTPYPLIPTLMIMYCACHVSIELIE